ncbi:MAG: PmoA family protein, partial [Planctomycetaceae bacterium]|nr:PmoA family protein [Planctomycetaceae bacterium]
DPPPEIDARYGRSGHIHPCWTPSGAVVTEQFPADHAHQSGLFLAYVKTMFEGRTPDFWNLLGGTGYVRSTSVTRTANGPVFGEFDAVHEHVDTSATPERVTLKETWSVRVWTIGGRETGYWVCDLTSRINCATDSVLQLPEYHYGGMALRGANGWGGDNATFVTSEGLDRKAGNHTRPWWCDLSGPAGEATAGILFMTHPANFRAPEPLRIHPTMPYMVYAPSFLGDWQIAPGAPHVSRYRFVFHDGPMPADVADGLQRQFAAPVIAEIAEPEM